MTRNSFHVLLAATITTFVFFIYFCILPQKSSNSSYSQTTTTLSSNSNANDLMTQFEKVAEQIRSGNSSGVLAPYFQEQSQFLIAPKYHLATCQIPKNMATLRFTIFCFLDDSEKFLSTNRTISTEFWNYSFCGNHFRRNDMESALDMTGENTTLFAVIRHPIDRFLSGYVDRCLNRQLCLGCGTDLRCFVETLHRLLMEYYSNPGKTLQDLPTKRLVRHFFPQTWYCDFKNHKEDYIFLRQHVGPNHTQRIADEFDNLFKAAGVPSTLRTVIHREMLKGTTVHSTAGSLSRKKGTARTFRRQSPTGTCDPDVLLRFH